MSDSFSELFRPKNPKQLIGESQRKIAQSLLDNVAKGKIVQEVLFSGDSGIGKTTIARMYISAVVGYQYDADPFNCGDKTGVDYIREQVIGTMNYMPLDSTYRVYWLDEIHKLSDAAQQSLLVAIEPVPEHVLFVTCTTDPSKLIKTLRGRLMEYKLTPPTINDFYTLTKWICKKEEKTIDDKTRDMAIGMASGSVRQYVKYLQQIFEGTFNGDETDKLPEMELIKLIISGNRDLKKWFQTVDDSSDFVRQAMGMVGYSISVLRNGNGQLNRPAMAVIKHFGNAPALTIDSKYTFFNRLLGVYEDVSKG